MPADSGADAALAMALAGEAPAAIDEAVATPVPVSATFRAAREALAQSGLSQRRCRRRPSQHKRRRRPNVTAIAGARLEHLICFITNTQMQQELRSNEAYFYRQSCAIDSVNRSRGEEVLRLSSKLNHLERQLCDGPGEDALTCRCCATSEQAERQEQNGAEEKGRLEGQLPEGSKAAGWPGQAAEEELRRRLAAQGAELREARREMLEAQQEAALQRARLLVMKDTHDQEVRELRRWAPAAPTASPAAGSPWPAGRGSSRTAAAGAGAATSAAASTTPPSGHRSTGSAAGAPTAPLRLTGRQQLVARSPTLLWRQLQEERQLQEAEKELHRLEVAALEQELQITVALVATLGKRPRGSTATGLAPLTARAAAAAAAAGGRGTPRLETLHHELHRRCEELYRPASLVFTMLHRPELPRVPPLATEGEDRSARLRQWLRALTAQLRALCDELTVPAWQQEEEEDGSGHGLINDGSAGPQ